MTMIASHTRQLWVVHCVTHGVLNVTMRPRTDAPVPRIPVPKRTGIIGIGASVLGIIVTFKTPWVTQWTTHSWRVWLAIIVIVSALLAIAIYAISEFTHRREVPTPTPTPAG